MATSTAVRKHNPDYLKHRKYNPTYRATPNDVKNWADLAVEKFLTVPYQRTDKPKRKYRRDPAIKRLETYKISARNRGIQWHLTDAFALMIMQMECDYCGALPAPISGIDRVDNALDYIPENVAPCCTKCNRSKVDMTAAEFISLARLIVERNK